MVGTKVYLDTWLLRELVSKKTAKKRGEAMHQVTQLRSNSFQVIVPQIVLGEAFGTIMRDYADPNDAHNTLSKLYDHLIQIIDDVSSCIPPVTADIMEKARKLKEADSYLGDTDVIIVAHALLDSTSQKLLTADRKLVSSLVIEEEEEKMRQNGQRDMKLKMVNKL